MIPSPLPCKPQPPTPPRIDLSSSCLGLQPAARRPSQLPLGNSYQEAASASLPIQCSCIAEWKSERQAQQHTNASRYLIICWTSLIRTKMATPLCNGAETRKNASAISAAGRVGRSLLAERASTSDRSLRASLKGPDLIHRFERNCRLSPQANCNVDLNMLILMRQSAFTPMTRAARSEPLKSQP